MRLLAAHQPYSKSMQTLFQLWVLSAAAHWDMMKVGSLCKASSMAANMLKHTSPCDQTACI